MLLSEKEVLKLANRFDITSIEDVSKFIQFIVSHKDDYVKLFNLNEECRILYKNGEERKGDDKFKEYDALANLLEDMYMSETGHIIKSKDRIVIIGEIGEMYDFIIYDAESYESMFDYWLK